MADDIDGVGFRIADEIAAKAGIHTDSDFRIRCGILYVLQQAAMEGHIYLPDRVLIHRAVDLLGVSQESISKHLMDLAVDKKLVLKAGAASETGVLRLQRPGVLSGAECSKNAV